MIVFWLSFQRKVSLIIVRKLLQNPNKFDEGYINLNDKTNEYNKPLPPNNIINILWNNTYQPSKQSDNIEWISYC